MPRDDIPNTSLPYDEETELCESLAPLIEQYGLATVQHALNAIQQSGAWTRGEAQ